MQGTNSAATFCSFYTHRMALGTGMPVNTLLGNHKLKTPYEIPAKIVLV